MEQENDIKTGNEGASYVLSSGGFNGVLVLTYRLNGLLNSITSTMDEGGKLQYLLNYLPVQEDKIRAYIQSINANPKTKKKLILKSTPADLTFERFWDTYGKKASKKKESARIWARLSTTDKIQALMYIPVYRSIKAADGTEMAYANTFLNNRNWD